MKNGAITKNTPKLEDNTLTENNFKHLVKSSNAPSGFTIQSNAPAMRKPTLIANSAEQCRYDLTSLLGKIKKLTAELKVAEHAVNLAQGNFRASSNDQHKNIFVQALTSFILKLKKIIAQTPALLREIKNFKLRCPNSSTAELDRLIEQLNGLPGILEGSEDYLEELKGRKNNISSLRSKPSQNNQPSNSNFFQGIGDLLILIKQVTDALGKMPTF